MKLLRRLAAAALALLLAGPALAQTPGVAILAYHRFGPVVADSMTVRTAVFEQQLAWLSDHRYRIIPLRTLIESLERPAGPLPERAVVITVDDGHKSVYSELFPLIRRNRFPVTLFIYPSAISNASYAMTWPELAEMRRSGLVEIESHTFWHPNFRTEKARLSPAAYRDFVLTQFTRSKEILERHFGGTVDLLAWPFGIHDAELERWAAEGGYRAAFALDGRSAGKGDNLMALPRYLMADADRGARFAAIVQAPARRGRGQ